MDAVARSAMVLLSLLSLNVQAGSRWITEVASYVIVDSAVHIDQVKAEFWQRTTAYGLRIPMGKVLWYKLDPEALDFDYILTTSVNVDELSLYSEGELVSRCGDHGSSDIAQSYS